MPVPAKRRASSQKYRRRAHAAIKKMKLIKGSAGTLQMSHRVNPIDGTYKGRVVLNTAKRAEKKLLKKQDIKKSRSQSASNQSQA